MIRPWTKIKNKMKLRSNQPVQMAGHFMKLKFKATIKVEKACHYNINLTRLTKMTECLTSRQTCASIVWLCMWRDSHPSDLSVPSFSSLKNSAKSLKRSIRSGAQNKSWNICRRHGVVWAMHRLKDTRKCLRLTVAALISRGRWQRMVSGLIKSAHVMKLIELSLISTALIRRRAFSKIISLSQQLQLSKSAQIYLLN